LAAAEAVEVLTVLVEAEAQVGSFTMRQKQ
jgi:hypothetical protein